MWIAAVGGIAGVLWLLPSRMREVKGVTDDGLVYRDGSLAPGILRPGAATRTAPGFRARPGTALARPRSSHSPRARSSPPIVRRASCDCEDWCGRQDLTTVPRRNCTME